MKCCLLLPSFVSCIKVYECEMVPFLAVFLEIKGSALFVDLKIIRSSLRLRLIMLLNLFIEIKVIIIMVDLIHMKLPFFSQILVGCSRIVQFK